MGLTIRDVAKSAGVCTATASNVWNKTGKVGRRTHLLVLSTVKRLGYLPNVHARHLASHDSRTLAIVAGRARLKSNMARLQAYEKSMQDLGLEAGPILPGDLRFEGGLAAGSAIAKLSPRPTAVVAINDLTAVGVIKGLLKAGCRV